MNYSFLDLDREDKLALVTLNRPEKRNALSIELRNQLDSALRELEKDDAVSVVVLLADGLVFCAGFDTKEFYDRSPDHLRAMKDSSERYHRRLAEFAKPIIAGIQGPAMGGGFDLATLCDVRIAAPEAAFAHPEIKFGAPALFGPLKEIIGGGLARDLVLTGRTIDAPEALRIGFVSQIVPASELKEACLKTARAIAESPQQTLKAIKRQIVLSYGGWEGYTKGASGDAFFDFL